MFTFTASVCFALLAALVRAEDKRCVTLFESRPQDFSVCRTTECFIFRTEIPFIWVPETMNKTEHQKPFPCSEYKQRYKGLKGPFFDIVNATEKLRNGTQCVWGGTDCQFDDMIQFVRRSTRITGDYKFIAGGLLFMLKYRISPETIASAPLLDDQLIVIGPRDDDGTTFGNAWNTMWRPFSRRAWVLLFLTALCVALMRVWIAYHFTIPWSWYNFRDNFLGDYDPSHAYFEPGRMRGARHSDPSELRRLNTYLANGSKIVFVIVILYYEISIVNFVFSEHRERMEKLVPEQFVITGNTTQDKMFKEYIQSREFGNCLGANNEPCWKQVGGITEVYNTITSQGGRKSERYRYSAVYESLNRYWFKKNSSLCQELQVLEYAPLNRRFAGVWYYSSNIAQERRTEMDMAIVGLREEDKIRGFVHAVSGSKLPAKCENSDNINYLQLGMPLFMFAGPIFCAVFFYMCLYTIRWRNLRENADAGDSSDDDDIEIENDSEIQADIRSRSMSKRKLDLPDSPSLSQFSICTNPESAEVISELLERMRIQAQIKRPSRAHRRWR